MPFSGGDGPRHRLGQPIRPGEVLGVPAVLPPRRRAARHAQAEGDARAIQDHRGLQNPLHGRVKPHNTVSTATTQHSRAIFAMKAFYLLMYI